MPVKRKLSRKLRNPGTSGPSALGSAPCGTFISSTMIVMMTAITPSVNASSLPLVMSTPAHAGDGLADELPQRLEQVERAQYAERIKADDAAALPAARTDEIHRERDDRKRRHADVEERPGPVPGLVLVEVVPPIDRQQREEAAAEVEVAERLDAAGHQRLDNRRGERDRRQQRKRVALAPVQLVPLRGRIRRAVV